jgi:hypothetical protein
MDYMLKRRPGFTRFLDDGRICLTNNAAGQVGDDNATLNWREFKDGEKFVGFPAFIERVNLFLE